VLQRQAQALAGYIYWEPNYLLMPYAGASVTVIHDLSHVRYPSCHPKSRVAELTERLPQTLRCASRVVAVSAFTREEIRACFPEVGDVAVVSPAVDKAFFNVTEERASLVAARYNLPSRYILSVATLEPRKNLQALLRAWSCLPPELQQSAPLVLAGHKGWLSEELSRQMEGFETRGLVRYLGYVPRADMAPLVAGATVLAYVSIYEGFGMPIAEAMAAGTAVVTSSTASMPEVADGAAYLVNPYSSESIRAGLSVLLCDDALRESYVARGRERAKCFTWQSSANALLDVVRPLAAR
jgi:alpha-1,3-rhamnosyl/mannosyltransferase